VSEHSQKRVVALKTEACRVKDLYHFIITDCKSPLREAHDLIEEHLAKCGAPGTAWEKVCTYGGRDMKNWNCNNFILLQIFFYFKLCYDNFNRIYHIINFCINIVILK